MSPSTEPERFPCSTRGAVARGKRLLAWLLLGLAFAMLALAAWLWIGAERPAPAAITVLVALATWTSWRMSGDLDLLWLERHADRLVLQLRRQRHVVPLLTPRARRLTPEERDYLELLASRGPIVVGTGGYDSHRLGEFSLYASNLETPVLVDTGESRLVVTPDDPEAFVRSVGSQLIG